jgi:hypothetical protein
MFLFPFMCSYSTKDGHRAKIQLGLRPNIGRRTLPALSLEIIIAYMPYDGLRFAYGNSLQFGDGLNSTAVIVQRRVAVWSSDTRLPV